jgi:hypothetical protein
MERSGAQPAASVAGDRWKGAVLSSGRMTARRVAAGASARACRLLPADPLPQPPASCSARGRSLSGREVTARELQLDDRRHGRKPAASFLLLRSHRGRVLPRRR